VQKLLDYQKYQEAAKKLYGRALLNRDVYARGVREDLRDEDSMTAVIVEDDGLFSMIAAYRRIIRKAQRAVHKVRPKVQSIAGRINEIKDRLIVGARVTLRDLLGAGAVGRTQLLITFLSVLELGRMGFVSVFQNENYGDIHIEARKPIEQDALERVQEFDSGDFESVASSIINGAIDDKIDMYETMMAEGPSEEEAGQLSLVQAAPLGEDQVLASDTELFDTPDVATDEEIAAAEAELDRADGASETPSDAGTGEAEV
jgi:segregation and condensation protein A